MNKIVLFLIGAFLASSVSAQYHRVRPRAGCNSYNFVVETATPPKCVIQHTSAMLGGTYLILGKMSGDDLMHVGVEVSKTTVFPKKFKFTNPGTYMFSWSGTAFSGTIPGLTANTTYYFRAVVYAGARGQYCASYGKRVKIKTRAQKGGPCISNNIIIGGNRVVCENGTKAIPDTLEGTTPSGGVDNSYTYTWQSLNSSGVWQTASGKANDSDYITKAAIHATITNARYRRIVASGTDEDTSAAVTVTYLPPPSSGNSIATVNIFQVSAGSSATTLVLEAKPIPLFGNQVTAWEKKTSHSSPFNEISDQHGKSSIIVQNPDTAVRYRASVYYHKGTKGTCAVGRSPDIGFSGKDGSGNIYPTVKITTGSGAKTVTTEWMINNLRTTRFLDTSDNKVDSVAINEATGNPPLTGSTAWKNAASAAYCWYNDGTLASSRIRDGALYNKYVLTVNDSLICPVGWHVATDTNWRYLDTALGETAAAFKNAKSTAAETQGGWSASTLKKNTLNFNALPTSYRVRNTGTFVARNNAKWWTPATGSFCKHWGLSLTKFNLTTLRGTSCERSGYSIRCVKD